MGLEKHQKDYKSEAWKNYSLEELGKWVHLFVKRAGHRTNIDKATKDLYDARNYLSMMEMKISDKEKEILKI